MFDGREKRGGKYIFNATGRKWYIESIVQDERCDGRILHTAHCQRRHAAWIEADWSIGVWQKSVIEFLYRRTYKE